MIPGRSVGILIARAASMPGFDSIRSVFAGWTIGCFLTCSGPLAARELEGSVSVAGNVVKVQVNYDDQTPATGARISLIDAKHHVIATGHINAEGRWAHDLSQAGSYEVRIDAGSSDGEKIEMPFSISPNAVPDPAPPASGLLPCCQPPKSQAARPVETSRFPWLSVVMGLGLIGGSGVVFWMSRSRHRAPAPTSSNSATPESPPGLAPERDA